MSAALGIPVGFAPVGFAPVVYEHAAAFSDSTPYAISRNAGLLFRAHSAAYEFYRHRPIAVGIDVYNLEAEAFGAEVADPGGRDVPSVRRPIAETADMISRLPDWDPETESRFGLVLEAASLLAERHPEADIRIPLGGPFSIASTLMGFDNLLCDCLTDPDAVRAALEFLARKQLAVARAAAARGFGFVLFDSAATPPLLSPGLFRDLVLPALRIYREGLRSIPVRGSSSSSAPSLILGGDTVRILDSLLSLDPGFLICPAETDQRAFMEIMREHPEVGVRLNMNASAVMDANESVGEKEAERVVAVAREVSVPGRPVLVGTGVLPVDAEPARVRRLGEFISRL